MKKEDQHDVSEIVPYNDYPDNPDPDDFLSPSGLRRFNRPGFFPSIMGMSVVDEEDVFDPSSRFVDGLIASLIATLVVFPLDVVKTRQQMTLPWEPVCGDISQCLKRIYRKEGIKGLFRGATIVVVMTTPEKALKQVSNEYIRYLMATHSDKSADITLKNELFAGFVTGLLPIIVNGPADMIKGQLQDAGRLEKPKMSSWQILRFTVKRCGVFGLYAGGVASILREVVFTAGYFPLMEHIRKSGIFGAFIKEDHSVLSTTFMSGLVAASLMAWITTPFEVTATRIQMSSAPIFQSSLDKFSDANNMKVAGKGNLSDGQNIAWTMTDPFSEAIIKEIPVSTFHLTTPTKPSPEKVAAYLKALRADPMPFFIPPDKPIRKYTPLRSNEVTIRLEKSGGKEHTPRRMPLSQSSIYYDVSQCKLPPISFDAAPSVGKHISDAHEFRSRPSVGRVQKKYKEVFRTKILDESCTGWGYTDYIHYRRVFPPPARKKLYTVQVIYWIFKAQGMKALFRGAACRVAAIAPRMAITQMLYSLQIIDRFF